MLRALRAFFFRSKIPPRYVSVCCIVKDENEYLEEWIRYHVQVGVEHFFIYDNGSAVPVKETLAECNLLEYATVIPLPGARKQVKAYRHCIKAFRHTSKWIAFIDVDEFIVPKEPLGCLPQLLREYESFGGLGVNWLVFGSGGYTEKSAQPQLERFIMRSEERFSANRNIKSIVQPARVNKLTTVHSFSYKKPFFCVNENFSPVEHALSDVSVKRIRLNHYYCRSLEEYKTKIERGFADKKEQRTLQEFYEHDKKSNLIKDTTVLEILKKPEAAL